MTRVRYTESNGVLVSRPMLAGSELLVAEIDTVNNTYIVKRQDGTVLSKGNSLDVSALKKQAKTALRTLGVVFDDEVRNRNTATE